MMPEITKGPQLVTLTSRDRLAILSGFALLALMARIPEGAAWTPEEMSSRAWRFGQKMLEAEPEV